MPYDWRSYAPEEGGDALAQYRNRMNNLSTTLGDILAKNQAAQEAQAAEAGRIQRAQEDAYREQYWNNLTEAPSSAGVSMGLKGAAIGGTLGSVATPIGTTIGTIGGAIVGGAIGVGAGANADYNARKARAKKRRHGKLSWWDKAKLGGDVLLDVVNPVKNTTGTYHALMGTGAGSAPGQAQSDIASIAANNKGGFKRNSSSYQMPAMSLGDSPDSLGGQMSPDERANAMTASNFYGQTPSTFQFNSQLNQPALGSSQGYGSDPNALFYRNMQNPVLTRP